MTRFSWYRPADDNSAKDGVTVRPGYAGQSDSLLGAPVPELRPLSHDLLDLKMVNRPRRLFETVCKVAGVNVIFDPDYDSQQSIGSQQLDISGTTLEQVLDQLSTATRSYWNPLSANTTFVTVDSPTKRRGYDESTGNPRVSYCAVRGQGSLCKRQLLGRYGHHQRQRARKYLFTYLDVGVNLEITPKVHSREELSLHLDLEVSQVKAEINLGGINEPEISQNKISADVRLREGEVNLIGGIIQQTDSKGITGIPGLATLPVLGRLFSGENLEKDRTELVIALVPHIVRAPEVGDWKRVASVTATQIRVSMLSDPASVQAGAEKSVVLAQSPPATAPPAVEISGSSRAVFIPSSIDTQLGSQATVTVFGAGSSDNTLISAQLQFDPQLLRIIRVVPEPQKVDIRNDAGRADIQLRPDPATAATAGLFSVVLQAVGRGDTSLVSGMAPGIVAPDPVRIQIR